MGRAWVVAAALLVTATAAAQDRAAADEMILQADRLYRQGRYCEAAPRYRAVVGERPDVFVRWAESVAACLRLQAADTAGE